MTTEQELEKINYNLECINTNLYTLITVILDKEGGGKYPSKCAAGNATTPIAKGVLHNTWESRV